MSYSQDGNSSHVNYIEGIASLRALRIDAEEALKGETLISIESQAMSEDTVESWISDNFPEFIKLIRYLSKYDQDILLGYYALGKSQTTLALPHGRTQTIMSSHIRAAMKRLAAYISYGTPTEELLSVAFQEIGLADVYLHDIKFPLAKVCTILFKCQTYKRTFEVLGLPEKTSRGAVWRVVEEARVKLEEGSRSQKIVAGYLSDLLLRIKDRPHVKSQEKHLHENEIVKTPDILGQFRIDVTDPNYKHIFVSNASHAGAAEET